MGTYSQNYGCQHLRVPDLHTKIGAATVRLAERRIRPNTTPQETKESAGLFQSKL